MLRRELLAGAAALFIGTTSAQAEVDEIRIARQPSLGYLPLMIMEQRQLIQKHAAALGLGTLKAAFVTLAGGAAMNDALLSNAIHFAAGGVPPLILLWSKTAGTGQEVRGVAAMNSMPLLLNTNNPRIKSLRDFQDKDKIALPALKVSVQVFFLQMAAEKELGEAHRFDLDKLTVTLSHPDGMAALFAGHEITAHFTALPIQELEARRPGIRTILNSFDVMGAPSTFNVVWASSRFVKANPKATEAFLAALEEAIGIIDSEKKAAAAAYLRLAKDPSDAALIESILNDPQVRFTSEPQAIDKYADFMLRTRTISRAPATWTDLFFPSTPTSRTSKAP